MFEPIRPTLEHVRSSHTLAGGPVPGRSVPLQIDPGEFEGLVDVSTILGMVTVLVTAFLIAKLLTFLLTTAAERSPSRRITIKMFLPVTKLAIYGIALYVVIVPVFQLSGTQLLALAGLIGAALGFGLQDLVSALFGGLVIVLEQPYQVGDKVRIDDNYGEVVDIGLRATKLQNRDDTIVVAPNDAIFTSNVANANDGESEMLVPVQLAIASDADETTAMGLLEDALVTSPYVYVDDDHPVSVRVTDQVGYRHLVGRAYVADLRYEYAFASDVTRRTLDAFEAAGIETPSHPVPGTEQGSYESPRL